MSVRTVVLDANIYVSALVVGGKPKRAFQLGVSRLIDVAISEPIRAEVLGILRDKSRWPNDRLTEARSLIATAAKTMVPTVYLARLHTLMQKATVGFVGLTVVPDNDVRLAAGEGREWTKRQSHSYCSVCLGRATTMPSDLQKRVHKLVRRDRVVGCR